MNRTTTLAALALAALSSCSSLRNLEELPAAEFQQLEARTELVAKVATWRVVDEGLLSPDDLVIVAQVFEGVALGDELGLARGVLEEQLRGRGLTDEEVLLAVLLVEDWIASKVGRDGEGLLNLSPRCRLLFMAAARGAREATSVSEEELEAVAGDMPAASSFG